jgi:hypothetical protein
MLPCTMHQNKGVNDPRQQRTFTDFIRAPQTLCAQHRPGGASPSSHSCLIHYTRPVLRQHPPDTIRPGREGRVHSDRTPPSQFCGCCPHASALYCLRALLLTPHVPRAARLLPFGWAALPGELAFLRLSAAHPQKTICPALPCSAPICPAVAQPCVPTGGWQLGVEPGRDRATPGPRLCVPANSTLHWLPASRAPHLTPRCAPGRLQACSGAPHRHFGWPVVMESPFVSATSRLSAEATGPSVFDGHGQRWALHRRSTGAGHLGA